MTKEEFSQIYYQEIDKVFRFFFLRVDLLEEAQDLTSLLFLKFYEFFLDDKNNQKEKKIKDKKAFLFRMAKNLLVDFYRRKNKNPLSLNQLFEEKGLDIETPSNLETKIELNWEMEKIKKALKEINSLYAEVIIWHYVNDLSVKEIASILNKKENNVRVLLHRALEALKKQMNK